MRIQPYLVVVLALGLLGCGSSGRVTTEILDKELPVVTPKRTDSSTVSFWDKYVSPTAPAFEDEKPGEIVTWTPIPNLPEAIRDSLTAVRLQLSRVLSKLNALQGNIGKLTVTRMADTSVVRYRDTTKTTAAPVVIETSWIEKMGIGAVGGIVTLLLVGAAVILIPRMK